MAKDNKIKLKALLNEAFGTWGVVTHAHPNRKRLQEQEPMAPGAPARPAPQVPKAPVKPAVPVKKQQAAPVNDIPEEPKQTPPPTENLNFKVQPGFKVEFNGKPGQYYIIRIMNTAMTNFLVVNDKIGKPIQFINVSVEKIDSDEKGKPFKGE
jgi:hypothetical protein